MSIRTLYFLLSVSTSLRFSVRTSVLTLSLALLNLLDFSIMSSTLTSRAVSESLDITSLLTHVIIIDDHRDNTSTVKDRQDAIYSLGDRPATEDYPNDISTTSTGHDTNHSLGEPTKDRSTPGYRPSLTQEDVDFYAAVLFCKQFLEIEKT
jgi:hypothetical protein